MKKIKEKIKEKLKNYPHKFISIFSVCCGEQVVLMFNIPEDCFVAVCEGCSRVDMVGKISDLGFVGDFYGVNAPNILDGNKLKL